MFSSPSSSKSDHKFESSSTNPKRKRFDVYLSFCAKDAGSFAMSIYKTLSIKAGFVVFWEDKRLDYGDRIITPLEPVLNVIGKCKIVVIIFSRNYANTRRCLQELKKITDCCRTTSRLTVLPLFHDHVYPSCGILKTCMFGDAFQNFVDRILMEETSHDGDKFISWVATISKATTFSGPIDLVQIPPDRNKSEHIDNLVERVTRVINNKRSWLNCLNTTSINSRVQNVIQLLKQSKCPLLIGIWGMAGIGKTTIAQAIYHQIGPYFEDKCFLKNVKGAWEQENGQVFLQQKLIFDMDKETEIKIRTIESGKQILKYRFRHKRVLLVLDNVDKLEQLNALCENPEWFGVGSKIIITTRNRHLLKEHGFDHIYRVKELDESESLELFNYGAFRQTTHPQEDFLDLSKQLVAYSGGWPPALKELGDFLRGKELRKWKDVLRRYQTFYLPSPEILEDLEVSFSDLSDEEKHIFLDIAYFFIGMNQNDVLQTLNRSTQCAALQINLLEDKSFLTIDKKNNLEMHVVLQAMAKDIIKRGTSKMHRLFQPKMYDVFLSFRGEDSRAKFISHLHSSLENAGIHVFKDDFKIQRGDQISISLLRAIGQSRISIVVLSTNYANSRWCMLELERIMEIGRNRGLVVVPVFYEVDPSEVRHQKGHFGKGFDDLISKTSVDESTKSNWRRELFDICGISGFVLIDSRNESADVNSIVSHVTHLLDRTQLFVAEHPVGVESRVQAATKLLKIQKSEDVLLLGIWGMGGMGKTTIAKSIYNEIGSKFEGRSFLLDIREFWETNTDLVSLQQKLLCDVYKTTTFKISDIESGKNILKERLSDNRVLLVS